MIRGPGRSEVAMPIALALVAGALASLNPCGFPLLPAFLSFYIGADADVLPLAHSRVTQGLTVGLLVSAGFMGVFLLVGAPLSYGITQLTGAIPWAGFAVGIVMVVTALAGFSGRVLYLNRRRPITVERRRHPSTLMWFGAAYAVCSLGCTLPVFVALVGASAATANPIEGMIVFGAYAVGMATTVMALAVTVAVAKDGLTRRIRRLLPHMHRISSALLLAAGAYLTYYWARVIWAPPEALSNDPLVGVMTRFATLVQRGAASSGGRTMLLAAGVVVGIGTGVGIWQWSGARSSDRT